MLSTKAPRKKNLMARTIYALIDLAGNIIKAIANNPTILGLVLLYLILVTQTEAAASG